MNWSIHILEYGYVDNFPASNLFAAQPNEGHRRMPYCFGLLSTPTRKILVDTGFTDEQIYQRLTKKYGRTQWCTPTEALARVGVTPNEIDTILLTHNHFDHAGCVDKFPNAHVWIQQREIESYVAAKSRPPRFEFLTRSCQPNLPEHLATRQTTLVDGYAEVAPGITLHPAHDTHTAGSQLIEVTNQKDGTWIFAGDNVYSYENLTGLNNDGTFAPIAMTTGSATTWLTLADKMLEKVANNPHRILPFHESKLWTIFTTKTHKDGLHTADISLCQAPGLMESWLAGFRGCG
ncbi:N-acyl homoserine lactonase family protein, partial [Paractinoplanes durhamensis]